MVRNYKRKTDRGKDNSWSSTSLSEAINEIKSGKLKTSVASRAYNIPETTLRRYLKLPDNKQPVNGGRFRKVFSDELEDLLSEYLLEMSARGFAMTNQQVCSFAYELAEENHLQHNFDRKLNRAGRDWLEAFMKRHRTLSVRAAEATSLGRLIGFNRPQVSHFFDVLKTVYSKYNFSPSRIFNCDETGLPTVPTRLPKVIAAKGSKRVAKVTSAERGKNVTLVCCVNAAGAFIPPAFLFARKKMTDKLMIGAPADAVGFATDSGWMTSESFVKYLEHFAKHARPTVEDPVLVMLDNHASHISLPAVEFCRSKGIVMVSIPPHCTHRLQPLDISFFGSLKTYYSRACDAWMAHHPGQAITEYHVPSLLSGAYQKAATVAAAVNGFRSSGIYPFDKDVFCDADFAAAQTTERANDSLQTGNELIPSAAVTCDKIPSVCTVPFNPGTVDQNPDAINKNPNAIVENADAVVENLDAIVENSDAVIENPDVVTENPDAVVEKPDAVSSDVPYSPPSSPPDNHLRMNS